jgi:hypothetical protein
MASFSVTEAVGSGFGVIGRKPLAVLAWGVVMTLLMLVPMFAFFGLFGGQYVEFFQMAMKSGGAPDPAATEKLMALNSGMMGYNLFNWLWGTLARALICAAIFRAVLMPEQSRFAYLRLGSRELWLALLFLVETVLAIIVVVIAFVAAGILIGIGYAASIQGGGQPSAAFGLISVGVGLAIVAVLVWIALRLSLAAPMTFAEGEFRLFESWTLTKGQGWRLLGVAVLLVLILLAVQVLFLVMLLAVGLGSLFGMVGQSGQPIQPEQFEAFFRQSPAVLIGILWPWVAGAVAISVVVGSVLTTVLFAPWASAYRALTAVPHTGEERSPSPASAS